MKAEEKVSILLVDDQASRLLSYEAVLQDLGENLVWARSGDEALRLLMQREFALILLDVNMPGMDGFETANLVHQHPRFEKTPIIFVTGVNISEFDRLKGYKLGAVDYVVVPVVPEILRSKVMVLVELYRQRRELQRLNTNLAQTNADLAHANDLLKLEKTKELEQLNSILEEANQRLTQAGRRKDEFLAMLGHELRNPLASICNALEIIRLKQVEKPDPELVWPREVLGRQIGQLARLVDDILDISRITRDQIELRRAPLDLNHVIASAVEASGPQLNLRRQQLIVELTEPGLRVNGDGMRIAQVLGNLLNNAAKYMPEGRRVWLSVRQDGDMAVCSVIDEGVGIPENMLDQIFEPFTQVRETRDKATGGLGMGLAIVRKLVSLHGGTVRVASAGLDLGSTFEIRLPLMDAGGGVATADLAESPAEIETVACRVLIADDDQDSANSLALMLRLNGHEVWIARNGEEAHELARLHKPQAALLDIGMPIMDGYQAAQAIRAHDWGKNIFLVAVTGWGQKEDRLRSAQAGFDAHEVKPIIADRILSRLAQLADFQR